MPQPARAFQNNGKATVLMSRYGERAVLDGLDGEIASGCLTALIGPNGSGKNTLLRVPAGLQPDFIIFS